MKEREILYEFKKLSERYFYIKKWTFCPYVKLLEILHDIILFVQIIKIEINLHFQNFSFYNVAKLKILLLKYIFILIKGIFFVVYKLLG